MPAWPARSAISAPTCFDLAVLSPDEPRTDASRVDADTSVLPVTSSISCANMCLAERETTRRSSDLLPLTFFLTLRWRREREAERALARPVIRPCARVLLPDILTSQPSRPCGGSAHPGTARPCPCTGQAYGACVCWRPPRRLAACRYPRRRTWSASRPGTRSPPARSPGADGC